MSLPFSVTKVAQFGISFFFFLVIYKNKVFVLRLDLKETAFTVKIKRKCKKNPSLSRDWSPSCVRGTWSEVC